MKTIVVATDFSDVSVNAAMYAVEIAKYFDARLILCNAIHPPTMDYHDTISVPELQTMFKEHADKKLHALRHKLMTGGGKNLTIECIAQTGLPVDVIEMVCERFTTDLLIIGITGAAGPVKEYLIGSTAVEVARKLNISTFIIPENVKYSKINRISFACDMDKTEDTDLVYVAKYFSKIFDAELEIINVEGETAVESESHKKTSKFIHQNLKTTDHHTVTLHNNSPSAALENYFQNHNAGVLMVSPKKYGFFKGLFHSSFTRKMAFHMKLPMLVIH